MIDDRDLAALAAELVQKLAATHKTVTTAESCTGGWIAKSITDIAGSSAVFEYGVVSYSNAAKQSLLGVTANTLQAAGAVSEATVIEMVEGAMRLSNADHGVAVSGIAGPDGGTDTKPVGTVCFAWSEKGSNGLVTSAGRKRFKGSRDAVRRQTVEHALRTIHDKFRA
tara:strand:+ start:3658 stop:4161 length:504 start_codon:yes stop_codon:yes gene_type:complete